MAGAGIDILLGGTGLLGGLGGWWWNSDYRKGFFRWLVGMDEPTTNEQKELQTIPTLSGAKNQSGYDKVIPLVLGRHQFTPSYCGSPYRTVSGTDGEKQTFHALYMLGYNDIQVTDLKLGMIDLAHNRDYEEDGQTVTCPTVDDGEIAVNGRWNPQKYGIHLELRQGANAGRYDGEVGLYPEKVIEEQLSIELMHLENVSHEQVLAGYKVFGFKTVPRPNETASIQVPFTAKTTVEVYEDEALRTAFEQSLGGTVVEWIPYYTDSTSSSTDTLIAERFSAKNPRIIEVEFTLNGLIGYNDNGGEIEKSVGVKIEMSLDGGSTYEPFGQIIGDGIAYDSATGTSTITRKKNKVMRFVARRELSYAEAINCTNRIAELRIQRTNVKDSSSNTADAVYLSAIRTWCYDYKKSKATENNEVQELIPQAPVIESRRNMTARLAIEIEADEIEFKNQIDELNAIVASKARTWNGTEWSDALSVTSNPASLMLMVMQHASRGKYAYSGDRIDLPQLGEFYEWCNQPRVPGTDLTPKYQCNGVLTNTKKTREIIDAILATARAKLILNDKKYSVWIDKPRTTPVMVLNNQNVLSASNSKTFKDLPDGYKIKFVNGITWQTDELKVLRDGVTEDTPKLTYESIELLFQTDAKQVWQNGRYLLACEKLRQETWSRKVSVDGNLIDIGSLVELQDDTISVGIGDGAEIKGLTIVNGEIIAISTDGNMYVDDLTKRYGIEVTCADGIHAPKVMSWEVEVTNAGEQGNFVLVNPIPVSDTYKPNVGDIVSFGFFGQETTQALCFGKKDNGDGTFDLTLVPYQEGIYSADSGTIPEFVSNVCDIPQRSGGSYEVDGTIETIAQIDRKVDEAITEAVAEVESKGLQPYIYASMNSAGLYVDSDNVTTQRQSFSILCHVIIANEEREFSFGQIAVPAGWQVDIDYHTVNVVIPEGTKITEGGFNIPIRYREIFEDDTLVDEDGSVYVDEEGKEYYSFRFGDEIITYNLPFRYVGIKGFNYKGKFNAVKYNEGEVPVGFSLVVNETETASVLFANCVPGDYITWTGAVSNIDFVRDGILRTSRLYKYCGTYGAYLWEEDADQTHTMNAMTDVMSVLDDELGQNKNNSAEQYLAKLVSNDIFVDRLIANTAFINTLVTSKAFIDKLATRIITLQQGGQIKSYWADNLFTNISVNGADFSLFTTNGLWKTFNLGRDRFCLTNEETQTPESLTYSSNMTIADLNSHKYLYVRTGTSSSYTYAVYQIKDNPYFKLDSDTGKITAKDMIAEGGSFNNIKATNMETVDMIASGGTFNNILISQQSILGGKVLIEGTISNSALEAGGELTPTIYNWEEGTTDKEIYQILDLNKVWKCIGIYNNSIPFSYIKYEHTGSRSLIYAGTLNMYDENMHIIDMIDWFETPNLPHPIYVRLFTPSDGEVLRFLALPSEDPHVSGQVYRDSNGNLKISLF